jgi:hypothetical protein
MNPTMTAHTDTAERNSPLTVDILVSENLQIMLIEGHVDLTAAQRAMDAEGSEGFSSAEHTWMRYADGPPGEDADTWREYCAESDDGGEPVTASRKDW